MLGQKCFLFHIDFFQKVVIKDFGNYTEQIDINTFWAKIYPQGSRKGEMAQMNCESVSFGF